MTETIVKKANDIGWRQFAISIIEMLRWPGALIIIVLILRLPLERLLDAVAISVKG